MEGKVQCARCDRTTCRTQYQQKGPDNCPVKIRSEAIRRGLAHYNEPEVREFARQASVQEFECYMNLPEGRTTRNPRVEEIAQFAKKMGYRKLGVAFCIGLKYEAEIFDKILQNRGFDVVSVCCKVGNSPKECIGITEQEKIITLFEGPGHHETMCNPITQAELLNSEGTEFNIMLGLCVGHDSLFIKYAKAPTTVLVVKDRVFGHNPAAGLYLAQSMYYRKLMRKEGEGGE